MGRTKVIIIGNGHGGASYRRKQGIEKHVTSNVLDRLSASRRRRSGCASDLRHSAVGSAKRKSISVAQQKKGVYFMERAAKDGTTPAARQNRETAREVRIGYERCERRRENLMGGSQYLENE
jgi:hypothetical protein